MEILPGAEDGSTPGLEGLCHISELHIERVRNCQGFVNGMNTESLEVKYLGLNARGQLQLSRKAAMVDAGKGQGGGGGGARGGRGLESAAKKTEGGVNGGEGGEGKDDDAMSKEEIDVIAAAIEGIADL